MGLGTLLIRADATPEIGAGHVMRCLALGQAWQDQGGSVVFVMANSTRAIRLRLQSEGFGIVDMGEHSGTMKDADFTCELAQELSAQCLVLDSYEFDSEYQRRLGNDCWTLVCLDDEGRCEFYNADIVINQNITADPASYSNCRPGAQLLLGTSFCMLRKEFERWREFRREIHGNAHNILVTLGGSPAAKLVCDIVGALSAIKAEGLNVVVALGESVIDHYASNRFAAEFPGKLVFQTNISDMAALMRHADIAISAAGSTCWELCLLGLPTVLLDVASNQTPVALELDKRKCALYTGAGDKLKISEFAEIVEGLLRSPELRETLSSSSRELVDGLGTQRVISAIQDARARAELTVSAASR